MPKNKYPYEAEINGVKIMVYEKSLFIEDDARAFFVNAGKDADSGMEYLNGLEVVDPLGNKFYKKEDIEMFINR